MLCNGNGELVHGEAEGRQQRRLSRPYIIFSRKRRWESLKKEKRT